MTMELKALTLKQNFSWNFLGSLTYSLSQWLILIVIARLGSPEVVGLYVLGMAITAPIIMLTNLQLRSIQATDTSSDYIFNDYIALRIFTGFIAIILTLAISIINDYEPYKVAVISLIAFSKVIDSYSDVIYGQLQQKERMDYIGISRIIKGSLTIITVGVTMLITKNFLVSLIILNITWFVILITYDRRKIKLFVNNIIPKFQVKKIKKLIILAFPLGVILMLGSLNTNIPRIIVEKYLGEEKLGYFAAITYIMVAGSAFVNAIGQASAPRLAKLYKNAKLKSFIGLLLKLLSIGIVLGIGGTLVSLFLGDFILKVVYGEPYTNYTNILIYAMIASIFDYSASFLGYGLTSMRLFKIQPLLGTIWLSVCIIFSLMLIPNFGLKGASFTLIVTSFTQFLLMLLIIIILIKKKEMKRM
ncbi:hypothetical protein CAI16_15005 [Virgibacillus dokdonensis]|uniref:Polysaccharide biosynthesis protein n=1 Tax=Virgibacillus dokdonensis TaxID=302167 RepID=A0A3E0WME9_9BACI|nr:oligosaccharide flippase family protein [Virgibacillus dokdonensis]RFA33383.1 hypothetical protein CAI16_15005 [Virgibacillus dokdonensis]